ncbi:MAG: hypothetical protein ACLGIR_09340 [Actinomycetes bacterium]
MLANVTQALILATEGGIPADHIAAQLAVPLAIVIFCGATFLLLWSNYGAKKGALVYGVAFFGFTMMLGVFWWFGAPGTPVATGLQNFPGQAPDAYQPKWFPMEPGSPRAQLFPVTNDLGAFQDLAGYTGTTNEEDPFYSFVRGDLDSAAGIMLNQYLPTNEAGGLDIGASRRTALNEAAGEPQAGETRADPFFTAEVVDVRVTEDQGVRVAGANVRVLANFADENGLVTRSEVVEEGVWFAFKEPGALWLPSAVWTIVSLILFALCLFGLDRIEQREKREQMEVEQPEDLQVPIAQ